MIKTFRQVSRSGLLTGFLLFCLQSNSWANDNKTTDPVEKIFINADHLFLNIKAGNSVYTGNVRFSQGEMVLTGDKVTVEQNNNEIERITVIGKPARYNHVTEKGDPIEAESEQMVYIASQNKLVLTVNARLKQPDHQVTSEKITYDTLKKIVIAGEKSTTSKTKSDSERVKITLTPKKDPQKK